MPSQTFPEVGQSLTAPCPKIAESSPIESGTSRQWPTQQTRFRNKNKKDEEEEVKEEKERNFPIFLP